MVLLGSIRLQVFVNVCSIFGFLGLYVFVNACNFNRFSMTLGVCEHVWYCSFCKPAGTYECV